MDSLDEIKALLEEIRDGQKEHFEAWQSANRQALERQEITIRDVRRRMKRGSIVVFLLIAGVVFLTYGLPWLTHYLESKKYTVQELVELYQRGGGYDDFAGERLMRMGERAKEELIRLSDDPASPTDVAETSHELLHGLFPSKESEAAIERYINRIKDPTRQAEYRRVWQGRFQPD
ncbi:MAG: hypothetical protein Q8Q12_03405 [bacterium]|nr:hypothetical protein [bacterium]